jgi:hypothetical protein
MRRSSNSPESVHEGEADEEHLYDHREAFDERAGDEL